MCILLQCLILVFTFGPQGIISDLFPGVVLPKPDYELLLQALNDNIAKLKLQPVPWFIGKIIQARSNPHPCVNVSLSLELP